MMSMLRATVIAACMMLGMQLALAEDTRKTETPRKTAQPVAQAQKK